MLLIAKIAFVILLIAGAILFFGKMRKKPASFVVGLCALTLIASLISGKITDMIPRPTDNVTITATGEKNADAKSSEVSIKCLTLEGKELELDNATEGKWFWQGDCYMWRPETDSRQPEGVTRSVTLSLPVGLDRALVFNNNAYRGIVEVTNNDKTNKYDLYSESNVDYIVKISSSNSALVYGYKVLNILLFAAIICALLVFPCFAVLKKPEEEIRAWFAKHWDKLYYFSIAALYVMYMYKVSSADGSFWGDEIYQLNWLYTEDPNKAYIIYNLVYRFWFNLAPYGQENLLLLCQIFVALTIFICGLIGNQIKGKRFGVILSSLTASSITIVNQASMELRPYAFLLFVLSLLIYVYIIKQKKLGKENPGIILLYGALLALAMDSHQFGLIVAGLMMVSDFILIVLRKAARKSWLEFILPAIYGVYWVCAQLLWQAGSIGGNAWCPAPNPARVVDSIKWMCSYDDIIFILLALSTLWLIWISVSRIIKKEFDFSRDYMKLVFVFVPVVELSANYFFSTVIMPSSPLYIDRYLMSIILFAFIIISYGIDAVIDILAKQNNTKAAFAVSCVLCYLCVTKIGLVSAWDTWPANYRTNNQNYKAAAEYVMAQNDIYCSDTLVTVDHSNYGGVSYYLTHNGKRDPVNLCGNELPKNLNDYQVIYVFHVWNYQNWKINLIEENFTLVSDTNNVRKYVKKVK